VTNEPQQNNTTTTFTYDDVGNLKTKTIDDTATDYSYNANDQLTTQGSKTFTYDANGNLVSDTNNTYEYDDKNRLISVTTPTQTVEYSYDANDNRVAKTTSNGTTTYLVDANTAYAQVITESKANGTTVEYTYGNDLLSQNTDTQKLTYLTDALGSTRALADSVGNITDNYTYSPYGALLEHLGDSTNEFLFTGEQYGFETDNYYLRARYYSPNSTRFLNRDSYDGVGGNPITQNHYAYANSSPSMYVDPSGYMSMITVSFDMAVMNTLQGSRLRRMKYLKKVMEESGCFIVEETLDLAVREGIYMWVGSPGIYVGKSNDNIDARIKDHIKKRFNGAEKLLKQLLRIDVQLPAQLLETMEQAIMDVMGYNEPKHGDSANRRNNYNPKKHYRKNGYRRFKKMLKSLCK
jgi:RHS repeat-associated protein